MEFHLPMFEEQHKNTLLPIVILGSTPAKTQKRFPFAQSCSKNVLQMCCSRTPHPSGNSSLGSFLHSFKNFGPLRLTGLFRGTFYDFSTYRVRRIELGISSNVLPARIGRHYLIEKKPCTNSKRPCIQGF